jgi:nucleoside diphosphate kinase
MVFVFLDPWTLLTGRLVPMIRQILDHGFTLLDFEFKTLSEADAEEIYRTNHPIREENSWHVARLIYPMGRSVGLLFGHRDSQSCACARMQQLKGKANPSLNKAGQLRYDFMAPNRCLSLMHSSDDLAQVRREAPVFFSSHRIEHALTKVCEAPSIANSVDALFAAVSCGLGVERIEEIGMGALFARLRLRLVKALWRTVCQTRRESLVAYAKLWEPLSKDTAREPVIAEARQYLEIVRRERDLLDQVVADSRRNPTNDLCVSQFYRTQCYEPSQLLRCLEVLSRPELYPQWDSDKQLPEGLLYDRWERLLFQTHLFNFDDLLPYRPATI